MPNIASELKTTLVQLRQRYLEVVARERPAYEQIVVYLAEEAIESEELQNGLKYANLASSRVIQQARDNSEELFASVLSSGGTLDVSRSRDYRQLKYAIKTTLQEDSASRLSINLSDDKVIGPNGKITAAIASVNQGLGKFFGTLHPITASILFLALGTLPSAFLALGALGIALGGSIGFLLAEMCLVACTYFVARAGASQNGSYAIPEPQKENAIRSVVSPYIRQLVNNALRQQGAGNSFHVTTAPDLTDDFSNPNQLVETASILRIRQLIQIVTQGSIGISGARGVGKTALLRTFCEPALRERGVAELRIMAPAPVDYDGRDFILHLFSKLSEQVAYSSTDPGTTRRALRVAMEYVAVIAGVTSYGLFTVDNDPNLPLTARIGYFERLGFATIVGLLFIAFTPIAIAFVYRRRFKEDPESYPRSFRVSYLVTIFVAAILCLLIYHSSLNVDPRHLSLYAQHERRYWAAAIAAAFSMTLLLLRPRLIHRRLAHSADRSSIVEYAIDNLRRINYIQTLITERSATAGWVSRFQVSGRKAREVSERDLTLPQIVSEYRAFITDVAKWWKDRHGGAGRIVVGIDEVDKIDDTQAAQRFLNEVKSIFGTPDCLYLVSISEDALIQFESQSSGFRSAFDSTFDEVVQVDTPSMMDARNVMLRRVAGIGDAFIALCYVVSGGLPRGILRAARALVEARKSGLVTLDQIALHLLHHEVLAAKRAAIAAIRADGSVSLLRLGAKLFDDSWPGSRPSEMLTVTTQSMRVDAPMLYTYLILLGTVGEVFTETIRAIDPASLFLDGAYQNGVLKLAHARRVMYIDSGAALELINASRRELGLYELI